MESKEGEGSRFYFTIPLKVLEESTDQETLSLLEIQKKVQEFGKKKKIRVAFVDPNETQRLATKELFANFNLETYLHSSVSEITEKEKETTGLFIVDASENETDLVKLEKWCKKHGRTIVLTKGSEEEKRRSDWETIRKPILLSELVLLLNRVLLGKDFKIEMYKETSEPQKLTGLKVLVAEDNVFNQIVIKRTLVKLGISNIFIVPDGKQAVDAVKNAEYHVILMDCMMPVMVNILTTLWFAQFFK